YTTLFRSCSTGAGTAGDSHACKAVGKLIVTHSPVAQFRTVDRNDRIFYDFKYVAIDQCTGTHAHVDTGPGHLVIIVVEHMQDAVTIQRQAGIYVVPVVVMEGYATTDIFLRVIRRTPERCLPAVMQIIVGDGDVADICTATDQLIVVILMAGFSRAAFRELAVMQFVVVDPDVAYRPVASVQADDVTGTASLEHQPHL